MLKKNVVEKNYLIKWKSNGNVQQEFKIKAESAEAARFAVMDLIQDMEILEIAEIVKDTLDSENGI